MLVFLRWSDLDINVGFISLGRSLCCQGFLQEELQLLFMVHQSIVLKSELHAVCV